ncbi:hypothetical protein G6F21_014374 [Rhizopus arrhizus]|nr:hypothetical protein G6F21_014374 [Rhizopus arrhizus]
MCWPGKAVGGLSLVHLGVALSLQGDAKRGQAALAAAFAKSSSERPSYFGDYGSAIRDDALMIALTHENKLAKPAWDARAVDLGRGHRPPRQGPGCQPEGAGGR